MEKLSWSHKLFLRINELIGNRPWRDRLMFFAAHWLIYLLYAAAFLAVAVYAVPHDIALFKKYAAVMAIALMCSYIVSYVIAWLFPHDRPVMEFPQIKELVHPTFLWKSFPSDHTIAVTILSTVTCLTLPFGWVVSTIIVLSLLVALGRIYVGVHYPRDIIGGLLVGSAIALTVAKFFEMV